MEGMRLIFTVNPPVRLTSLHEDKAKFFCCPWCTMIWMFVHLIHHVTHSLSHTAVMCMCKQCANYNVPFQTVQLRSLGHRLVWVQAGFKLFSPTTASLVSCSLVCRLRKIICTSALLYFSPCECVYVFINTAQLCLTLCWRWRRRCCTGCMYLSVCPSVSQYSC